MVVMSQDSVLGTVVSRYLRIDVAACSVAFRRLLNSFSFDKFVGAECIWNGSNSRGCEFCSWVEVSISVCANFVNLEAVV